MNRFIALSISTIFHPVFANLLGLLALLFLSPYLSAGLSPTVQYFYILFIFITTGIVPMLAVLVMKLFGKVQSILLDVQDERNIPYLITACMYLFDYYFLSKIYAPSILRAYVLACACIVVAVVIINHFYKISVHGASLGALVAIVISAASFSFMDVRWIVAIVLGISGLTLSARLFLYAHTLLQVITGWALGFMVMYLIL